MDKEKIELYIKIAKLYYESQYSQDKIAKQLDISRPTVSRILTYCKEKNIVQIKIINPLEEFSEIEKKLVAKYNLKQALVAYSPIDSSDEILNAICQKASSYLNESIKDGDIIGVCWGTTLYQIAKKLNPRMVRGVQIVQLKGGVSHTSHQTYANEIVELFSQRFNAAGRYLPLPTMFDNLETKKIVEEDPHIKKILTLGKEANIALFTVGAIHDEALLFKLGYFTEKDIKRLSKIAIGDICSRLIDKKGQICDSNIDSRTNGIKLEDLRKKEKRILVAGTKVKRSAIKAALAGGYANILITDQYTANALL